MYYAEPRSAQHAEFLLPLLCGSHHDIHAQTQIPCSQSTGSPALLRMCHNTSTQRPQILDLIGERRRVGRILEPRKPGRTGKRKEKSMDGGQEKVGVTCRMTLVNA